MLKGGSSVEERRWHGSDVGGLCWRAQWRGQWPHRFRRLQASGADGETPALHEMERDLAGLLR